MSRLIWRLVGTEGGGGRGPFFYFCIEDVPRARNVRNAKLAKWQLLWKMLYFVDIDLV